MTDHSDRELLEQLGIAAADEPAGRPAPEERLVAGFEEIQRFMKEHGREPQHGEGRDIFERIYAVRLERIRAQPECRAVVKPIDRQGLLGVELSTVPDDEALLAALGEEATAVPPITSLRHVRPAAEKRAAEEVANRKGCDDFDEFRPKFQALQSELVSGIAQTRRFPSKATEIAAGRFYILEGQKAYVASMGAPFTNDNGYTDARLRVIFDNGTESNLLLRSLQKALQQDPSSRILVNPSLGPLFGERDEEDDELSGNIYVLRSKSNHPVIAANRQVLHKIGVTGGPVNQRIANARHERTYLMADVELVATFTLYNVSRSRFEHLVHRIFGSARLNIEIKDAAGESYVPQEWFLVPLKVIHEAVDRIADGTITRFQYDPKTAALVLMPDAAS